MRRVILTICAILLVFQVTVSATTDDISSDVIENTKLDVESKLEKYKSIKSFAEQFEMNVVKMVTIPGYTWLEDVLPYLDMMDVDEEEFDRDKAAEEIKSKMTKEGKFDREVFVKEYAPDYEDLIDEWKEFLYLSENEVRDEETEKLIFPNIPTLDRAYLLALSDEVEFRYFYDFETGILYQYMNVVNGGIDIRALVHWTEEGVPFYATNTKP